MTTTIHCFINARMAGGEGISDRRLSGPDDGDCIVVAVVDNEVIASHFSSSESWARHDIGLTSDWKHDKYRERFPDGYELVWGEP